ncbi:small-conductance mechanosensitive channel [Variovorax boronicumulans]|uniref:Small-conductance mechanosensitive channel n=1 Tax=Variovorax boronicumulans TaxID=436515 RepID=A0AAW8DSS3_9BURK|nr:mechanosensitive ion channel family protein [Variovorax boronicumulans]MDP9877297.1 small-conductance mechanosensitive channel [Variovorax boronicumulans]MDP9922583.1 small-conductance mechanosensitive channel [Variovorax boronicumulans]
MSYLGNAVTTMLNPKSLMGAVLLGAIVLALASTVVMFVRRSARRVGEHLSDVTALRFVSAFAQVLVYLIGFVLYAHVVPELRALGTALLAGASVVSVVVGLAAKDTLGNLVAGFSLVLYRQIRVGDMIRLASPLGVISAEVQIISLGFTVLVDEEKHEVIVPNNIMMGSTIIRVARETGH